MAQYTADDLLAALEDEDWERVAYLEPLRAFQHFHGRSASAEEGSTSSVAYGLLAALSGMMLDGSNWERPYSPLMSWSGGRSAIPEDLQDEALAFISKVAGLLPPSSLAFRLTDVMFIRSADRGERYRLAMRAVDLALAIGLAADPDEAALQNWCRAAELAGRFKLSSQIDALVDVAMTAFRAADAVDAWHIARSMRLARFFGDNADEVADRLEALGMPQEDAHVKTEILSESVRWRRGESSLKRAASAQEAIGDAWWDEAKRRSDSHMVARDFLGNAYNAYRTVPRHLRTPRTQKRMRRLPKRIREEGELSLGEYQMISGGPVDMTAVVERAEALADEPNFLDALAAWFASAPLERFAEARAYAEQASRDHGLLDIFETTTVSEDARKIHSTAEERLRSGIPGKLWARMVKNYTLKATLVGRGHIWPAMRRFSTIHRLHLRDFEVIVAASSFIPAERKSLYARALHHGYYERLTESLFILAPTLEACVRNALQACGIETRNVRRDDTEIEPGLSALMELPGVDEALGEDLAWNIRALFCGPTGPNLRNRIAHGLLDESESKDDIALFAWWFAFRLAFAPYYRAVRDTAKDSSTANEA